ncbi:hypothetical protein M8C21_015473 [Ambrosia artemisiifolia]|uniref:TIMELESS-interacting protein n=1 Tax=Ambrosia artemisiifolia TaxID=4212 RepID=A0AAD5BK20_AMBAR|nr:hypothetical protein M8C21_015473 [Ambrosia artemisiifolia]
MCINDLRERIANGGDPTKLHETLEQHENINPEQDKGPDQEDTLPNHDSDDIQHNLFDEIFETTNEEPLNKEGTSGETCVPKEVPGQTTGGNSVEMTEEVKARIEANRLKALERAAARKRALEMESQAS